MTDLVPLKRVAAINAGQSPPSEDVCDAGNGLPFLQGNAEFGAMHPIARYACDAAPKRCRDGDILLSVRAPVGALNVADQPYGIGRGLCAITPHKLVPRYLWWAMNASVPHLQSLATGSTYGAVAAEDVGGLMVRVPSLPEQQAVADYLDADTARIDAVVRLRVQQRSRLDEREFALLSDVLVPGERRTSRLGFMASIHSGLTVDAQRDVGTDAVTRPYLRVANVHADALALDSVSEITVPRSLAERCTLRFGDVLMTEGGDLDKLGRGTMWRDELPGALHQNHVFAVRPDPRVLRPEYLALLTRSQHARSYFERTGSKTTGLASTSSEKILGLPVPSLTVEEQMSLVQGANEQLERMRYLQQTLNQQIELLAERRQALITAAVSGQLDIPGVAA